MSARKFTALLISFHLSPTPLDASTRALARMVGSHPGNRSRAAGRSGLEAD
jgi:hypothetical protein